MRTNGNEHFRLIISDFMNHNKTNLTCLHHRLGDKSMVKIHIINYAEHYSLEILSKSPKTKSVMHHLKPADFCGPTPKSVLAHQYTHDIPERLRNINEKANLRVLN